MKPNAFPKTHGQIETGPVGFLDSWRSSGHAHWGFFRGILFAAAFSATATGGFAAVAIFQQGAANPFDPGTYAGAADTMLAKNTNFGDATTLNFGGRADFAVGGRASDGYRRHSLLRFDVTALDGEYVSIDSITLRLHFSVNSSTYNPLADTIRVFELSSANTGWVEGTQNGSGQVGSSAWAYRNQPSGFWAGALGAATPGTDYVNTQLAATAFDRTELAGESFDFDFTEIGFLEDWIDGINPGLVLLPLNGIDSAQVIFHSKESSSLSLRPQLIVNYTPVPEPAAFMLLCTFPALILGRRRR